MFKLGSQAVLVTWQYQLTARDAAALTLPPDSKAVVGRAGLHGLLFSGQKGSGGRKVAKVWKNDSGRNGLDI